MGEKLTNIVVLGTGGDGLVVAEAVRQGMSAGRPVRLVGFLDDGQPAGALVEGLPVFGRLDDWAQAPLDCCFLPAIQKVRDMPRRAERLVGLGIPEQRWGTFVHPSAVVANSAKIDPGVFISSFVTVQPGAHLRSWSSIRAGANIGHDAVVYEHGYVGPNATLCGRAVIGFGAHLGPNSVVLDGKSVGKFAVVGIASAVTKDVPEGWVVLGNPAERVGVVAGTAATSKRAAD
jgi:sugar O-acyltransferase (sialic acid O-acetyltransferase NeuD family)